MDAIIDFLVNWGYIGMFLSALLAGTVVPFSSEAVLAALVHPATGLSPMTCLAFASVGNFLGGLTCYWMGRLGKMDWLEKYGRIKPQDIIRMKTYLNKRGVWVAFFALLPVVGELIIVSLGFMRSNVWMVSLSMFVGKTVRYAIVILAAQGIFSFF